ENPYCCCCLRMLLGTYSSNHPTLVSLCALIQGTESGGTGLKALVQHQFVKERT
ncbi:hypothetical protein HispidOSU_029276, partial [Sigmodon hispidus]